VGTLQLKLLEVFRQKLGLLLLPYLILGDLRDRIHAV
jgi:hypothetical protein